MLEPVPEGLVCLTFDDGARSHHTVVAPLLEAMGFAATFYITEGLRFLDDKSRYMTWEEVADLDARGFEIGNHTRAHRNVTTQTDAELLRDIRHIDDRCEACGIRRPTTFCYPGYSRGPSAVVCLKRRGFEFARRGTAPEFPYDREGGRGPAYDPRQHEPLLVPTTGAAGPHCSVDDLKRSVDQAREGKVCILTFHGVPDLEHPWVHTDPDVFQSCLRYLNDSRCSVIALRDLRRYVAPTARAGGP
jgi:hypothetical protein